MLTGWYGVRFFRFRRKGRLGVLMRWHLAELILVAVLWSLGAVLVFFLTFAGMGTEIAYDTTGFAGVFMLMVVASSILGVLPYYVVLLHPLVVWLVRRWLPTHASYPEALRLSLLGLAGITLAVALPVKAVQWGTAAADRYVRANAPPPQTLVHREAPMVLEWTLFTPSDVRQAVGLREGEKALLQVALVLCDEHTLDQEKPRCKPVSEDLAVNRRGLLFRPPPAPADMAANGACRLSPCPQRAVGCADRAGYAGCGHPRRLLPRASLQPGPWLVAHPL